MEFLKELFGGQALTYDQLAEAAKNKGLQVVDAAGGAYLPKADADNLGSQVATLTGQLGEANKKLEGYDPEWKAKAAQAQRELDAVKFDFALNKGLAAAGARSAKAVSGLIDREKLTLADDGELIGLEKQLEALKKGEDTAFLFAQGEPGATGMSHQNNAPVGGGDKKEEANAAFRSLFKTEE